MLLDHHLGDVDCGEGRVVGEVERLLFSALAVKQAGKLKPVSDWNDCLDTSTHAADAILDWLIHAAIRFELKGGSIKKR